MIISILLAMLIAVIGFIMVNKVGNYETVWGGMMIGGLAATIVLSLIKLILMML